ncbi:MAG: diaminobutyrate--2-oxoglutarate transaminase family protein [Algicola sp.]|nr:diaminobutyrate--2-oxoglutarate transaminase family protein [Algicola sp.]
MSNSYTAPIVRTSLPGPKSGQMLEKQASQESNARTYPRNFPIAIKAASGSYVEDLDGNVFLDLLSGAGVLALGHNHPVIKEAVKQQVETGSHLLDFPTPIKDEFIDVNFSLLPESMRNQMKIQFCGPTGADAIDAAIKLCKTYTKRGSIVSFQGGFHGSTQSTIALTGLNAPKEPLQNLMPGVHFFPYGHCYRCPLSLQKSQCQTNCIKYLENVLNDTNGGVPKPAAVILEMVQGEGGVVPAPTEFVVELRRITRELDIPLIVDEIQAGYGRTGTWYAFEQYGIEPDVVVVSKALGGGLPASIILYNKKMDVWKAGAHTGTFRGNQLAFAANVAMVEHMRQDKVLDNVVKQGNLFKQKLTELKSRYPIIGDVRGKGLMLGMELIEPNSGLSSPEIARSIQQNALKMGLLLELGGRDDCVIRLLPPLNISTQEVEIALDIMGKAISISFDEFDSAVAIS